MPHRSDEEALRAKLDERDRELAAAQRDLEAAQRLLDEQAKENERLRRGGKAPPRPSPLAAAAGSRPVQLAALAGAVAVLVAGLVVGVLVTRTDAPMPTAGSYTPPPVPAPPVPPAVRAPPPAPVTVHLAARATAVSGDTPVRAGDACTITATIAPAPVLEVRDAVVECAGTRLYGLRDEVFGVSMTELAALAWPGEMPGSVRYEITLSDTGPRSSRPEAVLRSWTGEGAIYQTGLGAFRVELDLDPVSEAVPEPPGSAGRHVPGMPPHAVRRGRVVRAEPAGLAEGTPCRLALRPAPAEPGLNTRAHVRCGTSTLYGAGTSGFLPREGDTLRDEGTTDADGDPAISIDLAAGTVSIRDVRAGVVESVEIALDPAPSPGDAAPPAAAAPRAPPGSGGPVEPPAAR